MIPERYFYLSFGLLRFRSPLLAESFLLSFPPGTKMFQFPGFPSLTYGFSQWYCSITCSEFPHSDICGSLFICTSPQLFAACHVLLRRHVPRHPPYALCSLIFSPHPFYSGTSYSSPYLTITNFALYICVLFARLLRWTPWQYLFSIPCALRLAAASNILAYISTQFVLLKSLQKFYNFNSTNFNPSTVKKTKQNCPLSYSY